MRFFISLEKISIHHVEHVELAAAGKELWRMPFKIISFIENNALKGITALTTLLEIRYLLRRKKRYSEQQIENFINDITSILEIAIPDEISLLEANKLQSENLLDPFDAVLLGLSIISRPSFLISRDKEFLQIASKCCYPREIYSYL
ncbi:MAG: PIN domain-containing protein [Candidatus Omnitrophota bacterium]